MHLTLLSTIFTIITTSRTVLADPVITTFDDVLSLPASFDPIKAAYWTGLPHHRRTPFSVSPDGTSAYLAFLDSTYNTVYVQQVDIDTFEAVGTPYSTTGYEASGLVAQNDGFALFATINATGNTDLPTDDYPIAAVIRVINGTESWRTPMNGPGVHADAGLSATPDANGDLVYSSASSLYAAYFVVTAYTGDAAGHYGDSIQYVDDTGALQDITSSSTFGCSHNTGIGLEAADEPPFASICAEDQGDIWLNTDTQYMSGVKIANENTTNGCSGEEMGGMSGSYSNFARFPSSDSYIFAWQSRGALDLTENAWMGDGYTQCSPRWLNHNVAITTMTDKSTLAGDQATSVVGAAEGDTQVNWITYSSTVDHQNVHIEALNSNLSMVTWEVLTNPDCQPVPLGCSGTFAGTSFQFVDSTGSKVGSAVNETAVTVSGDLARINGKLCWPFVDQTWDLSAPKSSGTLTTKMSFACAAEEGDSIASSTGSLTAAAADAVSTASVSVSSSSMILSSAADVSTVPIPSATAVSEVAAISTALTPSSTAMISSSMAAVSTAPVSSDTSTSKAGSNLPASSSTYIISSSATAAEEVQTSITSAAATPTEASGKITTSTILVTVTASGYYPASGGPVGEFCGL